MPTSLFLKLIKSRKQNVLFGIPSICSAHPIVIKAAIRRAVKMDTVVLIEATCNQVNQDGGYTGMTPIMFADFVQSIAKDEGLPFDKLILGGDHLGPNPWKKLDHEKAMSKAKDMIASYVEAGFTKIHLDASMGCAGEEHALDDNTVAQRAVELCKVAEAAAVKNNKVLPIYVLGTEVPIPGGADHSLDTLLPTTAKAAQNTIDIHRQAFVKAGLEKAWERVIAFVVQPGVEFGTDNVIQYDSHLAHELSHVLKKESKIVFEAHSTDYQSLKSLTALVQDGYPILKVGPGLTFAYREAIYALDLIASELSPNYSYCSLKNTMEQIMMKDPTQWQEHYHGSDQDIKLQRHYSYSDRIRYYWNRPEAQQALMVLLNVFKDKIIPETLLRQYFPQYNLEILKAVKPENIPLLAIDRVLNDYYTASS